MKKFFILLLILNFVHFIVIILLKTYNNSCERMIIENKMASINGVKKAIRFQPDKGRYHRIAFKEFCQLDSFFETYDHNTSFEKFSHIFSDSIVKAIKNKELYYFNYNISKDNYYNYLPTLDLFRACYFTYWHKLVDSGCGYNLQFTYRIKTAECDSLLTIEYLPTSYKKIIFNGIKETFDRSIVIPNSEVKKFLEIGEIYYLDESFSKWVKASKIILN